MTAWRNPLYSSARKRLLLYWLHLSEISPRKNTGYNSSLYWDSRQLDQAIARLSAVLNSKPLDMAFQVGDHSLQLTMAKDGQSVADNELRRSIQNVVQVSSEPEAIVDLPAEILPAKTLTAQQLHDQLHGEVRKRLL